MVDGFLANIAMCPHEQKKLHTHLNMLFAHVWMGQIDVRQICRFFTLSPWPNQAVQEKKER